MWYRPDVCGLLLRNCWALSGPDREYPLFISSAFIRANPYHQAYERGVKIIGAIAQDAKEVDHKLTAADMNSLGKDTGKAVLSKALKLVFNDRIFNRYNRTTIL